MGEADKRPLISVIVPVYKVEPYLRACVDSILAQTYTNLEIILVDDGSPDNCPAICDEYAEKDTRVHVIHKPNGGLSDARNAGMEVMSGEYLVFVDSDDILPENSVKVLYDLAAVNNADLVIGKSTRFADRYELENVSVPLPAVHCMTKTDAMQNMFRNGCASWGRLYRSDIHKNVYFPVGEINEDEAIVLDILERCETVAETEECVYFYRCRPDSITTADFNPNKLIWAKHCRDNLAWIREHHPELEAEALHRYCGCLVWLLMQLSLCDSKLSKSSNEILKELKTEHPNFKKLKNLSKTTQIHMTLQRYLPFSIYRLLNKKWSKLRHG